MLLRADVFVFCFAWITMAQLLAQEDKEKTTALKDLLSRIDLDELMKKEEPPLVFPKTLKEFEYAFNEHGQLRHAKTGETFVFNHKEDLHRWNQKRYEALGEIITQYVYERLEQDCNLRRQTLPVRPAAIPVYVDAEDISEQLVALNKTMQQNNNKVCLRRSEIFSRSFHITAPCYVDATEDEPKSFIYMSEDALSNSARLLVLIQGSGVVRAGQWARRVIINNDLNSGTQIPFISRAMKEGYGVMVLNPNENFLEVEKTEEAAGGEEDVADGSDEPAEKRERKEEWGGKRSKDFYEKYRNPQKEKETERVPVRDNSSPEEHTLYVWDHFISKSLAKNIFVVAHSYGGLAFVHLMIQREEEVNSRVCAVAMTDSVHNVWHQDANRSIQEWLKEHCWNWVASPEPLDTPIDTMLPDCPHLSAGTERHELTSWKSFHSIFSFFSKHLEQDESTEKDEELGEQEASTPVTTRSSNRARHEDF